MPAHTPNTIIRPSWLTEEVWPFEVRTFTIAGSPPVHYLDEGPGPTLILVHAGMGSFIWRDLIVELSTDFRCVTVDFPGAGLSGGQPTDVVLSAFVLLLGELIGTRSSVPIGSASTAATSTGPRGRPSAHPSCSRSPQRQRPRLRCRAVRRRSGRSCG